MFLLGRTACAAITATLITVVVHARGRRVICYNSAGSFENWRPDVKAVFNAEYDLTRSQFCPQARSLGLSSIRKRLNLGVWRRAC